MKVLALFAVVSSTLSSLSSGFSPSAGPACRSSTNRHLFGEEETEVESYGEASRKFRRDVFTHDDWVKHRSPDRFFKNIVNFPKSGVYRNLQREVFATTGVALFVMLYNMLTGEYTDLDGVKQAGLLQGSIFPVLGLPLAPFTLSSPSLGLLLAFRANTAYTRWDEARKNWG